MFYAGTDLKYSVFRAKSKLLAGDVGIIGFYELGRVWASQTPKGHFHHSYGGGLYFAPFDLIMLSGTVGFSEESVLFNFTLGTKFNLTF
jgi:outer membrane translocation and assembly module TamA